jgi:hypothetical protein
MTTYTTTGPVRGTCRHTHRTLRGALRCLVADQDGCHRQGGYSDRQIVSSDGARIEISLDDNGKPCAWPENTAGVRMADAVRL